MNSKVRFNHVGPQFVVDEVAVAVSFYSEVLGFELDHVNGEPLQYAVVFRDEVYVHLGVQGHPAFTPGPGSAFVSVSGVEEVWSRVKLAAPQSVIEPLESCDYGQGVRFRVFSLADPAGNILRIGEPLESKTQGA